MAIKKTDSYYVYKKLRILLISEMLGTCSESSIWDTHVLKKAQKEIKKANRIGEKFTKANAKYKGSEEISEEKQIAELTGILRAYQEMIGKRDPIPETLDEILVFGKSLQEDLEEVLNKDQEKTTVFMLDESGWPIISTHMILGNLKENLRIITNNTDKEARGIIKSKVAVGELMALDVKPIEQFVKASKDLARDENGKPAICERPISFEVMGKRTTAIARSQTLPEGTEFEMHLRIRAGSPVLEVLETLLAYGRNNGLGAWRGSGGKGAYRYILEDADESVDPAPAGGWK
jgi:hypothetical protein